MEIIIFLQKVFHQIMAVVVNLCILVTTQVHQTKKAPVIETKFDNDSDVFYSNQYLSFFQNATIIIENAN